MSLLVGHIFNLFLTMNTRPAYFFKMLSILDVFFPLNRLDGPDYLVFI